jgi:NTE family protein
MFQANLLSFFLLSVLFPKNREISLQSGLDGKRLLYLLALCFVFTSQIAFAQDKTHEKKPKIGLVLSGGGAKGFAHIGVLKMIEKAGLKIDYIGGTSMGAVVGGLYATGYSAAQIDSIFQNTNFDELLKDYIPRNAKSFYEKNNDELYAISLPFNNFKIGVPVALSKGMYNYNMLTKLTHKVRYINDFEKLPIPFVCVATNIETGEEVILKKGYLAQAMMASSSFPSLFSPVDIDGKLLIDGGVTNNYPIEEIKKMGADIVIGVNVQDDLKDRTALQDATRILVQITNLDMINKMKEKEKLTDIYIKPDIEDYSVISFEKGNEIVIKGEEATAPFFEQLKNLAQKNPIQKIQSIAPSDITIDLKNILTPELKYYSRAYVIGKLRIKNSKKISYSDLKAGINNLNATQNFSKITYSFKENTGGGDNLILDLVENKNNLYLKFGLHYDGLYKSALLVNLTKKKSLLKNDVISFDAGLGDNLRLNLDYYVDNGFYWSFGFKSRYNTFNRNVATDFEDGIILEQNNLETINIDFQDLTNQVYMQTVFVQKYLIGGGIEQKFLKIESDTFEDENRIIENSTYYSLFGYLKYDDFDNKYFPKKGWYYYGDFQSLLYSTNYTREFNQFSIAKGDIGFATTLHKNVTLQLNSEAGFKIGDDSVEYFNFVLGGYGFKTINNFRHFYGYDFLSIVGDSYIKSNITLDFEFIKKNHLNFSANYANVANGLFRTGDWLSIPKYSGYAIGYGLESVIGPIELKYSWSPELPKGYLWISAGFWF